MGDQSQRQGQFSWQAKVQGHGNGCHHYPEGKIRVFLGRHQEPPGQQVQGGCGQEGRHPQQCAEEDVRRRSACTWCAGRQGACCFKVSPEEKARMAAAAKAAARKLKVQQKQAAGKVASKAPKKVAKVSAGKKAASAGKKLSAKKTALGSKKPAPKSNKPGGKKGAKPSVKKPAPKMKSKSGKAMKK